MKIELVLVSSNENPEYYIFFPYIKNIWEQLLDCKCMLIYVGNVLPVELKEYRDDIIMFNPIENIHTAFIAQTVRLLYPCILTNIKNGIMIGDIDSIPMNKTYFTQKAEMISDDKLLYYSHDPQVNSAKEHNIPFNLASQKTWREIFNINTLDDIVEKLKEWNSLNGKYTFNQQYRSKCIGFHFDQQIFYQYIENWKNKNSHLVSYNLSERNRFTNSCNINNPDEIKKIKDGYYDDNFFLRPYRKKRHRNNIIKNLLLENKN